MDGKHLMGKRIHDKRVELGLTMEELGNKLGVQKQSISKWENGQVSNINRSCIAAMSELFGCNPVWLMGFEDAPEVRLKYSAPERKTVTNTVDQKSKPLIGETALRLRLYQAALNVPAPCLEVAIQLLNSLSNQTQEVFTCSEKCCHAVDSVSVADPQGNHLCDVELKNRKD